MNWVCEKEEPLADWDNAACLKEISFLPGGGGAEAPPSPQDSSSVFFSDVIEDGKRCVVCRVAKATVEIFDVSPTAESLLCWRVRLPSPVIHDVGIAHAFDAGGARLSIMFLTKTSVHRVQVLLSLPVVDVLAAGTTTFNRPSPPSAFCALDCDLVAIGSCGGGLTVVRLGEGSDGAEQEPVAPRGSYELVEAGFVRRLTSGLFQPPAPHVLAMAAMRPGRGAASRPGFHLLSFAVDGQLCLWEALASRGHLAASKAVPLPVAQDAAVVLSSASPAYLRATASGARACLWWPARSVVHVIELLASSGEALALREILPPFRGASPAALALAGQTLWGLWTAGQAASPPREQLFRIDLEGRSIVAWEQAAVDAGLPGAVDGGAAAGQPHLQRVALEGCTGAVPGVPAQTPFQAVFTLQQQHEVWKAEEDGFDVFQMLQLVEGSEAMDIDGPGVQDTMVQWWLDRIFLPGRYSQRIIRMALQEESVALVQDGELTSLHGAHSLVAAVSSHLQRRCAPSGTRAAAATAVATAATNFLRTCDAVWRRRHQVCGLGISSIWAPHSWRPAGSIARENEICGSGAGEVACPLLLFHGGISCVRAVHTWSERWWATLHLSRDLSNYEKLEVDDVLGISALDEWKLCTTAWLLAQCAGSAKLGLSYVLLLRGSPPPIERLAQDIPAPFVAHLARCAQSIRSSTIASELRTLAELHRLSCCPGAWNVPVLDKTLDAISGVWSTRGGSVVAPGGAAGLCLSDVLRGAISASECGYACTAMADLLLLCRRAGTAQQGPGSWFPAADTASWMALADLLGEQLPRHISLHSSMTALVPSSSIAASRHRCSSVEVWASEYRLLSPVRACDLWASVYRAAAAPAVATCFALRAPVASFRSPQYAMQLLCHECWAGLESWTRQQGSAEVAAYFTGRRLLAAGQLAAARDQFELSQGAAAALVQCLRNAGLLLTALDSAEGPGSSVFSEHLSVLFARKEQKQEELQLLKRAAASAEGEANAFYRQRLCTSILEKALSLENWQEVHTILQGINPTEAHFRLLSQKLRSGAHVELLLGLPEGHRALLVRSMHEQALAGTPTEGSDSLACYRVLFALHFTSQDYQKAATIAYAVYLNLGEALKHVLPSHGAEAGGADGEQDSLALIRRGCCSSNPSDVPKQVVAAQPPADGGGGAEEGSGSPYAKSPGHVWPLLAQQRNALLMLISALSQTKEKMLILASPVLASQRLGSDHVSSTVEGGDAAALTSKLSQLREWFASAESLTRGSAVPLEEVHKLLVIVEAQMVLSGKPSANAPFELARKVASLGLLGLALQIAQAHSLDVWQCALQPFTKLCTGAKESPDEEVASLVDAARGAPQVYMFVGTDGCEPLGATGNARKGWWRMLEECLQHASGCFTAGGAVLNAHGTRLYSLVADEVLTLRRGESLPGFITAALTAGQSWVCLLRLYMKHERIEDAVDLLAEQLQRCEFQLRKPTPGSLLPPLLFQDFPVVLVVQLQQWAQRHERELGSQCVGALNAVIDHLKRLFSGGGTGEMLAQAGM